MKKTYSEPEKNTGGIFSAETLGMALVLFSSISVLLMLLSDVLFGHQWFYTQFLYGVFGYFAFPVFVSLCCIGVNMVLRRKGKKAEWKNVVLYVLMLFFVVSLVQVITASDIKGNFHNYIDDCYNRGENGLSSCTAGGALFGILVYPALNFLTPIGCYILYPVLMFIDLMLLFKVAITNAVKKATGKSFLDNEIIGVKDYSDMDFDFGAAPGYHPVSNKLYYGNSNNEFSVPTKRDEKSPRDISLNLLYPDRANDHHRGTVLNSGTRNSFTTKRTGDFSGQTYLNQVDRDFNQKVNYIKTPPAIDVNSVNNNFARRASVSERRNIDFSQQPDRHIFNHNAPDNFGRENSQFRPKKEDSFSRSSNETVGYDRISSGDSIDNKFNFERNSVDREQIEVNPRITNYDGLRPIEDNLMNRNSDYNINYLEENNILDESRRQTREDNSPFADRWDTISKKQEVEQKTETQPKTASNEDTKPSNVSKYNLTTERKAIYIEPDTGEAVMPEDEQPKQKGKTDADKKENEQIPIIEQNDYIGIPEMPIRYKYHNPPIDLYNDNPKKLTNFDDTVEERCRIIEKTLENFNVPARVENVVKGPTITRYEISIPEGVTVSKVPPRASDLAMRLEVEAVRIEAPIPGKNLIGIEVPNKVKDMVGMKELLLEKDYQKSSPDALSIVLGQDVVGNPVITDLTKTPHLLVAGATGMGKSVFLNALIMSLVTKYGPQDLRLVLVDPKQVEFTIYENLPHLLINQIITEASLCIGILDWAIDEMELRYKIFRSCYAQKIDEYNSSINPKTQKRMPKIVIIIDELGDLFSISPQVKHDIEDRIKRLTQKARAAGIHVVVATQRPDVTVITGVIKTNLPSRIAFKVLNYADSNTILNDGGADKLLGNGDMIFKTSNSALLKRIQGAYVSKDEIMRVLAYIRENNDCYYDDNAKKYLDAKKASTATGGTGASVSFGENSDNENDSSMFNNIPIRNLRALRAVILNKQASISLLQRKLSIGYSTAGRIIDWMESMNYISQFEGSKAREVLITMDEFERLYGEANLD